MNTRVIHWQGRRKDRIPVRLGLEFWAVVTGAAVLISGCGKSEPAPTVVTPEPPKAAAPAPPKPPAPPAPKPMKMAAVDPVTVYPASKARIKVKLDRQGNEGPIHFEFADATEGISATGVEIPPDKSEGEVEIAASEKLGDEETKGKLKVIAKLGPAPRSATPAASPAKGPAAGPVTPSLPGVPAPVAPSLPGVPAPAAPAKAPGAGQAAPPKMPSTPGMMPSTPGMMPATPGMMPKTPGMMPATPGMMPGPAPGMMPGPMPGMSAGSSAMAQAGLTPPSPTQAEQVVAVTVPKVKLPSFLPTAETAVQPGVPATIELAVDRTDYTGPMEIEVENVPGKFTGKAGNLAANQRSTKLEVTAMNEAPEGKQSIRVFSKVYGRTVEVKVPLLVDRTPFRVQSFMVVNLKPGETKRVQVPVERRTYKGPLRLETAGLPEGVRVKPVEVAANQTSVTLEFTASEKAKERVRSAKVVSAAGDRRRDDPMIVRVSLGGKGFLPREVLENPNLQSLLKRGSFGGRLTAEAKQALLAAYGGTEESEAAVLRGLKFLAAHQREDGSWPLATFWEDVEGCDCQSDAGKDVVKSDTAGTAFGVLPFLGAGITHRTAPSDPPELAEYKKLVFEAVKFLSQKQTVSKEASKDGTLDGNMYAHAIGTIALCEAFGLSGDERLRLPAQRAIKHIIQAQHKEGGWRYGPNQPGDMSAVGWQFLAIRSGQLAGLMIEKDPLLRASRFVDSCAAGPDDARKSRYSYMPPTEDGPAPQATPSVSAAGLLTRQYLGWKKDMPDLVAGAKYLMGTLPPESGGALGPAYYYYYATQVLHHLEGPDFDLWNHRMREHLIRTQLKEGHKAGSWSPEGVDWGKQGGRLYATSMAILTLQVYYRHLPLYRTVFEEQKTVVE